MNTSSQEHISMLSIIELKYFYHVIHDENWIKYMNEDGLNLEKLDTGNGSKTIK